MKMLIQVINKENKPTLLHENPIIIPHHRPRLWPRRLLDLPRVDDGDFLHTSEPRGRDQRDALRLKRDALLCVSA